MKSKSLKYVFLIISIFCNLLFLKAQSIELSAFLDTNVIEIGDQTYFNLQVKQPNNLYIQFPDIQDNLIEGIEVLSRTEIDTLPANSKNVILTQKYLITSFEDSIFVIPRFDFLIDTTSYQTDSLYLAVTLLNVDSTFFAKLDTTQTIPVFDIKEPINTPLTFSEFWKYNKLWILSLLFAIILISAIIYLIRRYKQNRPIVIFEKPKEAAHVIALRKFESLKERKLWQQDRIKEYYTELTDILREYIELRFNIQTFEKTSNEILSDVIHAKFVETELTDKLRQILFLSDMVKFAKGKPLADENDTSFQHAVYFVEKTIPITKNEENKIDETNNDIINLAKNE
jgi:hypothetical protein